MATTRSVVKVVALALLVVCALQTVQASAAAAGTMWQLPTCVCAFVRLSVFDRRDHTDSCLCIADSSNVGSYTGRALKQVLVGCAGQNVVAQCPKGYHYLCSKGKARGGCRAKAMGPFPSADCQKQCHTT